MTSMKTLLPLVLVAGSLWAAEARPAGKDTAPLGSPEFLPSPTRPIGWRGDGTGQYRGATPTIQWERAIAGPLGHGLQQSDKPKGETPGPEATDLTPNSAMIDSWLVLGPFPAADADPQKALELEAVPGEANLAAELGAKVKEQAWRVAQFVDKDRKSTGFWTGPNMVAYSHAYLYFTEAGNIDLSVQHEGGLRCWINGKQVYSDAKAFKYAYCRARWFTMPVQKGWNRLLAKNDQESWCGAMAMPTKGSNTYTTKNIRWTVPMPDYSYSTPVIVGKFLYTTSEPNDLICLDKQTGKVLWVRSMLAYYAAQDDKFTGINLDERKADVAKLEAMNEQAAKTDALRGKDGQERVKLAKSLQEWVGKTKEYNYHCPGWGGGNSAPTPCTDGENLYFWQGEAGLLGCYGLDGTRKWVRYIHPLGPGQGSHHGVNGSPVITGDKIVIPGWGCFLGVEKATGKLLWRAKYDGTAYSTHMPVKIGGVDALILPTGRITKLADGATMTPDFKGRYDGECVSTALDAKHGFFAVMNWGEIAICKVPQDPNAKDVQVINKIPPTEPKKGYSISTGLFDDDGLLYYVSTYGLLQVADVATGKLVYTQQLPVHPVTAYGPQGAGMGASVCKAGGNIYLFDNRGTSIVVAPGRAYKQLAVNRIQDLNDSGDNQEVFQATPIFDGNAIYVRGSRNLYCISEK
ncbi:MAG: PQQ-binding-like beta-propeller repeat protein [Planctomycetota bacterium]|nr:PQQ-binding-like beta-propeller repeat protein [Planctomycetota bacterium]